MEKQRIALLSNVNMNFVIRMLQKDCEVYQPEGYGNELGLLMNPESSYHKFRPDITFLVMDLAEVTGHESEPAAAKNLIDGWFADLEGAVGETGIFYLSDAYLWCAELDAVYESGRKQALEQLWQERLETFAKTHGNVRIFPYRRMLERLGEENAFSWKMWYMGKILLSSEAQKRLCGLILEKAAIERRTPKKVLALDLDNTLWGGLAGEAEHTPISLSEEHGGLAYKNLQRVILQMQKQGVLLTIVSKNNAEDAEKILREHPHMVLRPECFAAKRINWEPKHENLKSIAEEMNLGLDSFVFWDDNPAERELVSRMLPQVTVPDFPEKPEELAEAMTAIYKTFFEKPFVTKEDREKTGQYAANAVRSRMRESAGSFEDYLKQLRIVLWRENPMEHTERLLQLLNKTNQFNLTTGRYTQAELLKLLAEENNRAYLYRVEDCFGDNGIAAAVIVDISGEIPLIRDFVMSCRVMGRNIEYAIVEDIESDMMKRGFKGLRGAYVPTAKNKPVEELYTKLGYRPVLTEQKDSKEGAAEQKKTADSAETAPAGSRFYEIALPTGVQRVYYVEVRK